MSLQIVNVLYYPDGTEKTFVVGGGYTREKMKKDYCFDSCSHPPSKLEFLNMKNKTSIVTCPILIDYSIFAWISIYKTLDTSTI